ncbi:MAG: hypothetical protein MI923_17260, partial [Phycisphaerales bacterium]|nr:hypothetical protein [Phycisphaerales bacterium]
YYLLRAPKPLALDCLDLHNSEFECFRSDPTKIKRIRRYVFLKDRIEDPSIFHLPQAAGLFCTQSIKSIIEENSLRGFCFMDAAKRDF